MFKKLVNFIETQVDDIINQIFEMRTIPNGTFFMTDWGVDEEKFLTSGHHAHKKSAIVEVLNFYLKMKFILIGDSGQQDPEIYSDILTKYPERIRAIYIRDVTTEIRDAAVKELVKKASETETDLVFAEDSEVLAEHAAARGFIRRSEIPAVAGQAQADREEAFRDGSDSLE